MCVFSVDVRWNASKAKREELQYKTKTQTQAYKQRAKHEKRLITGYFSFRLLLDSYIGLFNTFLFLTCLIASNWLCSFSHICQTSAIPPLSLSIRLSCSQNVDSCYFFVDFLSHRLNVLLHSFTLSVSVILLDRIFFALIWVVKLNDALLLLGRFPIHLVVGVYNVYTWHRLCLGKNAHRHITLCSIKYISLLCNGSTLRRYFLFTVCCCMAEK